MNWEKHKSWTCDYHVHTRFSDGKAWHEDLIDVAEAVGLTELGFSDHVCLRKIKWALDGTELEPMIEKITQLKSKQTNVSVKFGLEMDYLPGYEQEIAKCIGLIPADYVIGSIHFIDEWNFDSEKQLGQYQNWDCDELYRTYFKLVQQAAQSQLFDFLGHLDLIKKFGMWPTGDLTDLFEETADVLRAAGSCIEVNTSGYDKPCQEQYPSRVLLEMCQKKSIPLTLTSDAHNPRQLGRHFSKALELIHDVGYRELALFTQRKRMMTSIFRDIDPRVE